jgi:hypothetical protein
MRLARKAVVGVLFCLTLLALPACELTHKRTEKPRHIPPHLRVPSGTPLTSPPNPLPGGAATEPPPANGNGNGFRPAM